MRKPLPAAAAAFLAAALLAGCHGSKEPAAAFSVPDSFDESRTYEISFWAKTTPTRPRRISTNRPSPISRRCIPTSP